MNFAPFRAKERGVGISRTTLRYPNSLYTYHGLAPSKPSVFPLKKRKATSLRHKGGAHISRQPFGYFLFSFLFSPELSGWLLAFPNGLRYHSLSSSPPTVRESNVLYNSTPLSPGPREGAFLFVIASAARQSVYFCEQ
jgi:hypothetical protein